MNEETKKRKMEYDNKYQKESYDRITLMAPKGFGEDLNEHAKKKGISRNLFMYNTLSDEMKRMDTAEAKEKKKQDEPK